MKFIAIFFSLFVGLSFAQDTKKIVLLGNYDTVCLDNSSVIRADTLPGNLNDVGVIMLFSGAHSSLSNQDVERIVDFVEGGGGLYAGAENWPLQAESNQMTKRLYLKESFGEFEQEIAEVSSTASNLDLGTYDTIPAGRSTVAFPMDYRLKVEAWVEDQPLILSGKLENGRVIVDGGYSRFYCNLRNNETDGVLTSIINYLLGKM